MPTSLRGIAKRHREMSSAKRITLKSPVREFRTPGSVGGRSGNWPSYPDDVFIVVILTLMYT